MASCPIRVDMLVTASSQLEFRLPCARFDRLSDAGSGCHDGPVPDRQWLPHNSVDDRGTCSDVNAGADPDVPRHVHPRGEGRERSYRGVVTDRRVEIDVNMLAEGDTGSYDRTAAEHRTASDDVPAF